MSLLVGCASGVLMLNDRHWLGVASGEGVLSAGCRVVCIMGHIGGELSGQ